MNKFIRQYIEKLKQISSKEDVITLYHWFWDNQESIAETAYQINDAFSLIGDYKLQPDLPCITVGSTNGLLLLAANPGWDKVSNKKGDAYCKQSKNDYINMMLGFYKYHPIVIGKRITWWNNALSWVKLLENWKGRFGTLKGAEKWEKAHTSGLVGGWELFPFHSSSDGLSKFIHEVKWLKECAVESLQAALRLKPEIIFIVSKRGWELIRNELLPNADWSDGFVVGKNSKTKTKVSYYRYSEGTEVIAVAMQMFSAPRKFTNKQLLEEIKRLRTG